MLAFNGVPVPPDGQAIEYVDGKFVIPQKPVIPFIEGDGTGRDIWKASQRVFDAAGDNDTEGFDLVHPGRGAEKIPGDIIEKDFPRDSLLQISGDVLQVTAHFLNVSWASRSRY